MRIRLYTEIEIDDEAIVELQEKLDATPVEQRPIGTIEFITADSFTRQVEKVVMACRGVTEVKSVFIPQLLGL